MTHESSAFAPTLPPCKSNVRGVFHLFALHGVDEEESLE